MPMTRTVAADHTQLITLRSAPRDVARQSSAARQSGTIGAPIPADPIAMSTESET